MLILVSFFVRKKFQEVKEKSQTASPSPRKVYYVQFDFSSMAEQEKANFGKILTDTSAIREAILAQIIPVLTPDSVVAETDLIKSFSNNGKLYLRHAYDMENDIKYFKDTLKFNGAYFFKGIAQIKNQDTVMLDVSYHWWTETGSSSSIGRFWSSKKDLRKEFRNDFQDALMSQRNNDDQGIVLDVDDNTVLFKMTKDAILRTGASVCFCSFYSN